jgi:hypothetical protein
MCVLYDHESLLNCQQLNDFHHFDVSRDHNPLD